MVATPQTTKPTLFLDVDGVVSPFPSRTSRAWPDWKQHKYAFNLELSQMQAAALKALPVDIVWLTTWENLANTVIAPKFGWEELPVKHSENYRWGMSSWWKYEAVLEHLKLGGGPFVWADDDIEAESKRQPDFTETLDSFKVPYLLMPTKTAEGLTPQHIDMITTWCDLLPA